MKTLSLVYSLKLVVAALMTCVYAGLCFLAYHGLNEEGVVSVGRHVVLVMGFVPLLCWLVPLVMPAAPAPGKLFLLAFFVTVFHVFVFAVSAHASDSAYWVVQLIEASAAGLALGIVVRGGTRGSEQSASSVGR